MDDHRAILALYARYANTIDEGDASGWAHCFTPDGALLTSRPLEVRGRLALERFAADFHAAQAGPFRHVSWHHLIDIDGTAATGRCSAALLRTTADGVEIAFTAVYRDRFVRAEHGWLIAERSVALDTLVSH